MVENNLDDNSSEEEPIGFLERKTLKSALIGGVAGGAMGIFSGLMSLTDPTYVVEPDIAILGASAIGILSAASEKTRFLGYITGVGSANAGFFIGYGLVRGLYSIFSN